MKDLFTVIIPTYNSGKFITRTLNSILACQEVINQNIHVIIVDDYSTEDFTDKLKEFENKLDIRYMKTEYKSGGPANGRELGAKFVETEYLFFMDHDDELIPEGFVQLKELIENNNCPEYICTGIRGCDNEGNNCLDKYGLIVYTHGKFFNVNKFYKKADLHFKKDIYYLEDMDFNCLTNCNLIKYDIEPVFTDFCTYKFYNTTGSLGDHINESTKDMHNEIGKLESYFWTTENRIIKFFKDGYLPLPVAMEWLCRSIVETYLNCLKYWGHINIVKMCYNHIDLIRENLKISVKDICDYVYADHGRLLIDQYEQFVSGDNVIETKIPFNKFMFEEYGMGVGFR